MAYYIFFLLCLPFLLQSKKKTRTSDSLVEFQSLDEFNSKTKNDTCSVPWCNYCKETLPHVLRAITYLSLIDDCPTGVRLHFGKVDCELTSDICSQSGVNAFPTFKFMSHGKQKEWTGGILTDDFAGFGTKVMRKPSASVANSKEEIDGFNSKNTIKARLISNNPESIQVFKEVADQWFLSRDIGFALTKALNDEDDDEKEGPIKFDSGLNDTFLVDQFINNHSLPLFAEISIGNWGQLLSLKKPLIIVAAYPSQADSVDHEIYLKTVKSLSSELKENYLSTWMNAFTYENFLLKSFGLSQFPSIVLFDGQKNVNYYYEPSQFGGNPLTQDKLLQFLDKVNKNEISANGLGSGYFGILKYYIRSIVITVSAHPYFFGGIFGLFFLLVALMIMIDPPDDIEADEPEHKEGKEKID